MRLHAETKIVRQKFQQTCIRQQRAQAFFSAHHPRKYSDFAANDWEFVGPLQNLGQVVDRGGRERPTSPETRSFAQGEWIEGRTRCGRM